MKRKIFALIGAIILATLTALPFGAHAVTITTGCGGDTICQMSQLLEGATIQVDDKLFHNFRNYSSVPTGGANPIAASAIQVTDYKVFGGFGIPANEIGIVYFELVGNTLFGGQTLNTSWAYTVESLGAPIVDNTLLMSGGGFAEVENGARVSVEEFVVEVDGTKSVFDDESGLQPLDHLDFGPESILNIETQMFIDGGPPDGQDPRTQLLFLVQTFSQQQVQVPEPATLGLFAIGLAALGFRTRRSSRRSNQTLNAARPS